MLSTSRQVPIALALLLLLTPLAAMRAAETGHPNIVVILSDDFGYGSAGCYGANPALVKTPHIDRLAAEGRRFTDGNTTSSVCSPTRYSLLTGRYCWRTSLKSGVLSTFAPLHIEPTRLNLASLLKKHGYSTAAVGKWHLGYGTADDSPQWRTDYTRELSPGPLDIGFDYHFSVPSNHGDLTGVFVENRFVYGLRSGNFPAGTQIASPAADDADFKAVYEAEDTEGGRGAGRILELDAPRRKNERVMAVLTDKAAQWIERQPKDKPFFLYFTPVAVHNPVTPDQDLAGQSAAGLYGDWIQELDRSVGRILDTLDRQGAADNTLVIFTSDNGGVFKPHINSLQTAAFHAGLRVNGPLRGGKHDVWEGGFKVPFIVRWPGKAPAGSVCNEMISLADLLATTAAIVGEELPAANVAAEDSCNFLPAILGDPPHPIRESLIVHSSDGVFAIRSGPWKWVEGTPVDETKPAAKKLNADQYRPQLFNTQNDRAETADLSAGNPEVVRELRTLLTRYRNGGYSREMPPMIEKPRPKIAELPPLTGQMLLDEPLRQFPSRPWAEIRGQWQSKDGGLWGAQQGPADQGATLRVPLGITDGVIQYEINFRGANRHSLRVEWGERQGSFRIEVSRNVLGITKNPSQGEGPEAVEPIARKSLELEKDQWYPVRITFQGKETTAQVNDVLVRGTHPVLEQPKTALNFLVFGETAGIRNVKVVRP